MKYADIFDTLKEINQKPKPFEYYTVDSLWTDAYVSQKMLELHLDPNVELASRKKSFIDKSLNWIIQRFNIDAHTKICDFGCGPGLYTTELARHGANITGIDFSENSIKHAKKLAHDNGLNINYELQDYLNYNSEVRFDLITMIYCDFSALSPTQRQTLLKKFHALLAPKGEILLDVFSISQFNDTNEKATYEFAKEGGFWSAEPYFAFLNTFKYNDNSLILDKWTIIDEKQKREIYNWLQCYTLDILKDEFNACGLEIIENYANVAGEAHSEEATEIAVVARKV